MPKIIIDSVEYEVEAGQNLIQAAASVGITIPHYCYHPGLSVSGNCRMCLVEVKGPRGVMPQIACSTPVSEGLEVMTTTDTVKKMRQGVMEFLLLNHPIDCPICDQAGECGLQDYYMDYGLYTNRSTVPKVKKNKVVDVGPLVMLDQERCILCSRCVRFCKEITHSDELVITGRGEKCRIDTFPGKKLDNPYSANVVDICPVGALTSKDFRFKKRVWFLNSTKSICTGCARGCNIQLDHEKGSIYRYRPRTNPEVNAYWLCDEGRLSYKSLNENRLQNALIHGEAHPLETVLERAQEAIGHALQKYGEKAVAGLASPQASLEDNFCLKALLSKLSDTPQIWGPSFEKLGEGDDFLRHPDKTPNQEGIKFLGIDTDYEALKTALMRTEIKLLIILDNHCQNNDFEHLLQEQRPTLIYLGSHRTQLAEKADFSLPITSHAEHYGSYINCEQRLQKVYRALLPVAEVQTGWQSLSQLFMKVNKSPAYQDLEEIWKDLASQYEALKGLSFYELPDEGLSLKPTPVEAQVEEVALHD
ncbi:NADH-quinone oxidoreductase subunit L [bacterium (Candidatus Blackallbacteria) CG17_big_fil_post_rev_8_21_14_2_50_48_46]|uniref:NADH-quinone oxidoreductase subunit L n=1 Tax=bacterium (Candidatus Blackallbacteria) CG17_big_fil_post_rev_8_21_14_2_50_48_46 TaxID=2014261 RepID=A0A2M7G2D0_9BACT|nr:MAG: NADH-quinone oxidoreductase subunit L [bacterium (Candidatus Blackallbacteria) CG18_big_fil_WC_8_21_14_2_50_49_26]PIW15967.1 MAG: NADH-quinone oxidoreductase subunit L [bacterium (Candidatus Blackallbacteria) CG17_big_fil_post_rev_8_21_14_2_50_48_46]PIW50379.1 MAG: NADH-quinone oxidoreductase subunit L [bacterium (Candidatus Blackallbacteria) CG13_big_fil_rev_8_21_14_2_50_49_14]